MEYTIYVITNEVNGKEYVGVTSDLERRWRKHKGEARRGRDGHLYNAMRKHGADQFSIQPVEHVEAREQAFDVEKQWIADLDTFHGEGYNMTPGGDSPPIMTGEDNPMHGRGNLVSGENNGMHGRTGEDNPMHGRTGEDNPMHGKKRSDNVRQKISDSMSGEDHPMYGRTWTDHPMHGRTGEDHHNCKLSNDDVRSLKWYALHTNLTQAEIGQKFDVAGGYVSDIKTGKSRPNLDPKPPADNGQLRLPLGAT